MWSVTSIGEIVPVTIASERHLSTGCCIEARGAVPGRSRALALMPQSSSPVLLALVEPGGRLRHGVGPTIEPPADETTEALGGRESRVAVGVLRADQ
jgi:hypothetical protein